MSKRYVCANRDQLLLMPPDLRDWIHKDHEARLILTFIGKMDLKAFYGVYETESKLHGKGRPPYDPSMMLALIYYCSAKNQYASRQIERMTHNDLGARFIAGNHHPDHDSFAAFRIRHQGPMAEIFGQVLMLCKAAGIVGLEHVAYDSTIIKARASRSKNLEVATLDETYEECKVEAIALIEKLAAADKDDEAAIRKSANEAKLRESRIKRAMDFLNSRPSRTAEWEKEKEERESQKQEASTEREASLKARGKKLREAREAMGLTLRDLKEKVEMSHQQVSRLEKGLSIAPKKLTELLLLYGLQESDLQVVPELPSTRPTTACPKTQSLLNETDPESYLTFRKAYGYRQAYLAQAAVDKKSQIIVAIDIAKTNDDHPYVKILTQKIEDSFHKRPQIISADTGYNSEAVLNLKELEGIDVYCPPPKGLKNTEQFPKCAAMRAKLKTPDGKSVYDQRSGIVEPVFGNVKHNQGFTRFLRIGFEKVLAEWTIVATTHNLKKLFKCWI